MRKYKDISIQIVYENSRDCLYFGYGFKHLCKNGLSDDEAKRIWNQARDDMAEEF